MQDSRREFLRTSGKLTAMAAILGSGVGSVLMADSNPYKTTLNLKGQMPMRTLGKTNPLQVSALAFGCMGLNYHRSKRLSEKEASNIVAQALSYGINFFDTAQVYGPNSNEILTGKILKPYRDKVIIATKFGFGVNSDDLNSSPKRIRQVVEQSLKRLNLESLHLLYQHRFDPKTPIEEVADMMKSLIQEGKVMRWGVCELSAKSIEKAHKICPLSAVQSEYHLMWRNVESELLPTLERLGIGFVAYSPLARGYLSGKLTKNSDFDPNNDNRATFPRYQDEAMRANYQIITLLQEFGKAKGANGKDATPAQIALAYLLAKKPYIVPLFGTTNPTHLLEDVESLQVALTQKDIKWLDSKLDNIIIVGDRYPPEQAQRVGQ